MGNTASTSGARMAGISNLVAEVGNDVQYEKSMGSSRFLKAIKARHSRGPIVVKTFIKPEPGMSLANLVKRLRIERESLADVPNVLTYQKVIETEHAGYLIRQWLASNLYDRISTRPFLAPIEKKWITYQLLYAMRDARGRKVAHGDLKCEDILVTSSLMVYVTDFAASFKPTFLPLNDPADFSFFFDTSGRRSCYVAPERFFEAGSDLDQHAVSHPEPAAAPLNGRATAKLTLDDEAYMDSLGLVKQNGTVTEAMDVFSMGCVIAELWRDGTPTFTLSQLFKYRQGNSDVETILAEIPDVHIRELVRSMIALDPADRKSFDEYLMDGHNKAFPSSFYDFFHHYLVELQRTPSVAAQADGDAGRATATEAGPAPSATGTSITGAAPRNGAQTSGRRSIEADERIERLYEEWAGIVRFFDDEGMAEPDDAARIPVSSLQSPEPGEDLVEDDAAVASDRQQEKHRKEAADRFVPVQLNIPGLESQTLALQDRPLEADGTALVVLSVILANLRNCSRPSSKCHALDLLLHLSSQWLTDETKLDRVIPFVISLLDDETVTVRMAAIRTCTQLLLMVRIITPSNASIIPEYIMPNVKHLSLDPSTAVRCVYASCIFPLADTGERFLQMAQAMRAEGVFAIEHDLSGDFLDTQPDEANYDAQLSILQNLIQEQIVTLLTDPSASVKRALIADIEPLCRFFGVAKTNDVLLSHMITYLNDRNWHLREAFFRAIVGVAKTAGNRSLEEYILPLTMQALSDPEEHVVAKVLNGFRSLIEDGLFEMDKTLGILAMTVGFLCHPNVWLREGCAGLVEAAATKLDPTDLWAIVYPSLRPLLRSDIHAFTEVALLDNVKEPLPRPILAAAIAWASKANKTTFWKPSPEKRDLTGLQNGLATEGVGHLLGRKGRDLIQAPVARTDEDEAHLDKLRASGMSDEDEVKLVALRDYIRRASRQTSHSSKSKPIADWADVLSPSGGSEGAGRIRPAVEVQPLDGITPQTIFFSPGPPAAAVAQTMVRDNVSLPTGTFRSQDDASFTAKVARRRLIGQQTPSDGSMLSAAQEIRRRMFHDQSSRLASMTAMSSAPRGTEAYAIRALPGSSMSPLRPTPASPAPSQTQARLGLGKASAAVAPSRLNATGTMSDLASRLRHLEIGVPHTGSIRTTPVESASHTVRGAGAEAFVTNPSTFSSTYDGNDPYIRAHLEAVYLKNFRDRPEFGPRIQSGPPRRRGTRAALPSGPRTSSSSSNRRPEGNLIAYFSEHTAPVTSIAVSPDHLFFVSGSEDGTLKIWDTARLEKNVTSRSRATYSAQRGSITAVIAIEGSHCLASTATDGSLHVWRVDVSQGSSIPRYAKPKLISNFQLSTPGEHATCLVQSISDSSSILILGTTHSRLMMLDLRTMQVLKTLRNPVEYGPVSCLCIDQRKAWLLVGTLGGKITLWDLRFGLLLRSWEVSASEAGGKAAEVGLFRVNRIALHPSKGGGRCVLVASEKLPGAMARSSGLDARASLHGSVQPSSGGKDVPSQQQQKQQEAAEVLVETWDIDRGIRVETFEAGPFPSSSKVDRPAAIPAALATEATSADTMAAVAGVGKSFDTAAAIEKLLEQQRMQQTRGDDGAQGDSRAAAGDSEATTDDEDDLRDDLLASRPEMRTGTRLRDILRPPPALSCSVRSLYVSLEGYTSSSVSSATGNHTQIVGGWLDAGKLAAEADEGANTLAVAGPSTFNNNSGGGGGGGGSGVAGYMLTAGEDRKIRFWDLGRVEKGVCIGIVDEKSEFRTFSPAAATASPPTPGKPTAETEAGSGEADDGTPAAAAAKSCQQASVSVAQRHVHHCYVPASVRAQMRSPLLAHPQTQAANALSRVHKDAITALAVIEHPFRCIVAGDRAGCLRVWE
ncbi:Serine/threonine-protein kinase [Thecaphora frezii]